MIRSGRSRVLAGLLAVLVGVGGVYALVRYVQTSEQRALEGQQLVDVFVVDQPIPAGTPADEVVNYVTLQQIPRLAQAQGAVTSLEALGSQETATDLVAGEQLIVSRFAPPGIRTVGGTVVPDGLMEITLRVEPQRALGGNLRAGDYVAVVASFDALDPTVNPTSLLGTPTEEIDDISTGTAEVGRYLDGGPASALLFRQALVTNIQSRVDDTFEPTSDGGSRGQSPQSELLITVAVLADQAERLVFAAEYGHVWLIKDSDLAPDGDPAVVTLSSVFLDGALADSANGGQPDILASADDSSNDSPDAGLTTTEEEAG